MTRLDEASRQAFLDRFYQFYDGVVHRVTLDLESTPTTCDVVVDAQDTESPSGWSRVYFQVRGCSNFRFEMGRTTFEVLSSGIQIGWTGGQVILYLDAYPDDEGLPDVGSNKAYVAGEEVHWKSTAMSDE